MAELNEFLAMGGYARFVWPAYAITLIVIGGLAVHSVYRLRVLTRQIAASEEANPRRERRSRPRPGPGTDDTT